MERIRVLEGPEESERTPLRYRYYRGGRCVASVILEVDPFRVYWEMFIFRLDDSERVKSLNSAEKLLSRLFGKITKKSVMSAEQVFKRS